MRGKPEPTEVAYYEGLIRKTAAMYAPRIQDDYEDIVSVLRIKVWRALLAYDPERSSQRVEKFVFSCVTNQVKDLLKRKRRPETFIEDLRHTTRDGDDLTDSFEHEHMAVDHDEVYADVERELPVIPSTLTAVERQVIVRLYRGDSHRAIALELGITRANMVDTMRSIRLKMADWRPSPAESRQPLAA